MPVQRWDKETDVIIVGTGFSGLAAAIEAFDAGARVMLLEKMAIAGGNSVIAGGGVNAVDPSRQQPRGIKDSVDLHVKQTFEGGDRRGDIEKIRFVVENALEMCLDWLEHIGVCWPERVTQGFGALWERTHTPANYKKYLRGAAIIYAELDQIKKRKIPILLKHKVTKIIRERTLDGKIVGVETEAKGAKIRFKAAKGVILASGGFGANLQMVSDHDPRLSNTPTTNHRGATGECIKMAQDVGAETIGMGFIQCIPITVRPPLSGHFFVISSKELKNILITPAHKIFVNKEGERFVREDARRDDIASAVFAQQRFEASPIVRAETVEELEEKLGIPSSNLVRTLETYNAYCESKHDLDFSKRPHLLIPCKTPPFEGETKALGRHYTMGGLKVEGTSGRVLDRWGKIIPHLFAIGEITGGVHGANRLGHNATPECIVFGRVVGRLVAAEKPL